MDLLNVDVIYNKDKHDNEEDVNDNNGNYEDEPFSFQDGKVINDNLTDLLLKKLMTGELVVAVCAILAVFLGQMYHINLYLKLE